MIHAYDKNYLDKAQVTLASMLDYAINDLSLDISTFFDLFIASGKAALFESGDPNTLVGRSGTELAMEVLHQSNIPFESAPPSPRFDRTKEYWCGWALAYYQWSTALSFSYIIHYVPISEILALYDPYHEMDVRQFCDQMNELMHHSQPEINLQ